MEQQPHNASWPTKKTCTTQQLKPCPAAPVVVCQLQRPLQRWHVVQRARHLQRAGLPVSGEQLLDEPQADAVRFQLCPLQRRLQLPPLLAVPALCCSAAHVAQQHAVPARRRAGRRKQASSKDSKRQLGHQRPARHTLKAAGRFSTPLISPTTPSAIPTLPPSFANLPPTRLIRLASNGAMAAS